MGTQARSHTVESLRELLIAHEKTISEQQALIRRMLTALTGTWQGDRFEGDSYTETCDNIVNFIDRLRAERRDFANRLTVTGELRHKDLASRVKDCINTLNGCMGAARQTAPLMPDMLEFFKWWLQMFFKVTKMYEVSPSDVDLPSLVNELTRLTVRH